MLYSNLARLLDNIVNRQDLQEIDSNFCIQTKRMALIRTILFLNYFKPNAALCYNIIEAVY